MLRRIPEIVCVQDQNREKFNYLSKMSIGWGLERVHFASTDAFGLMRAKIFGKDNVLMVIGHYTTLFYGHQTRETYVALLLENGVTQEQVIVLEGNESPEQIENTVRERISALLS